MSNPKWLAVVVVMQGLILATLWTGGPAARPASAQVPDAGAQQQQVIDQLKATNEKLDKVLDLLAGGNLRVQMGPPVKGGR
jgi:hypothetical protein